MVTERPYIICHMMSTLDGKIASGGESDILGDYFGIYTQTEDMLEAKAWMCGRVTMQMFASNDGSALPLPKKIDDSDYIAP